MKRLIRSDIRLRRTISPPDKSRAIRNRYRNVIFNYNISKDHVENGDRNFILKKFVSHRIPRTRLDILTAFDFRR